MRINRDNKLSLKLKNIALILVLSLFVLSFGIQNMYAAITSITPDKSLITGNSSVNISGSGFLSRYNFKDVQAGDFHTLALSSSSKVYAWGQGNAGQLGDGLTGYQSRPIEIKFLADKNISKIIAGHYHNFAISSNGKVYAWGQNTNGQLGLGHTNNVLTPVEVPQLSNKNVKDIYTGTFHSMALTTTDKVYSWGVNSAGQLGIGSNVAQSLPVEVTALAGKGVKLLAGGWGSSMAVTNSGDVYSWGSGGKGQLGINTNGYALYSPTLAPLVKNLGSISQLKTDHDYSMVLLTTGKLYVFGDYPLSDGHATANNFTPKLLAGVPGFTQIGAGWNHSVGLTSDNKIYTWGSNDTGQIGNGTVNSDATVKYNPTLITSPASDPIIQLSAKGSQNFLLSSSSIAYGWGRNGIGQIGVGHFSNVLSPKPVSVVKGVSFGETSATFFSSTSNLSDNSLTNIIVPPHTKGKVDVKVIYSDGTEDTLPNSFTYYTIPNAPVATKLTPLTNSAQLTWTTPTDDGLSAITGYTVEYKKSTDTTWTKVAMGVGDNTALIAGLDNTSSYDFRVKARNAAGDSPYSNILSTKSLYITASTTSNLNIAVNPGKMSSAKDTISADSNNLLGYKVYLSSSTASTDMVHTVNSANKMNKAAGSVTTPGALADNRWGFRVNGVGGFGATTAIETNVTSSTYNWAGITPAGTLTQIKETSAAGPTATDVYYGLKSAPTAPSGTYKATVMYTVVSK